MDHPTLLLIPKHMKVNIDMEVAMVEEICLSCINPKRDPSSEN
jgi:hypothetical protein